MQNGMVNWASYGGVPGFDPSRMTPEMLGDLLKSLSAGASINNPGASAGEGFPLRVESLERVLRNATSRAEHIRLWKAMPKRPAFNTVEEYNLITSYGEGTPGGGFVAEGALPMSDDSTYERKYAVMKYMGTTRVVTHQMTLVKPAHGSVIANETVAGTMHLLRLLESALFNGDSSLSALQFDGYSKMIRSQSPAANNVNMHGGIIDEDALVDGALLIQDAPNYGRPTHLHLPPKCKADTIKAFFPKARYDLMEKRDDGKVGLDLRGFTSPAGDVIFEPNTFITDGGAPPSAATSNPAAAALIPGSPTVSTGVTTPVDGDSEFEADDAGSYYVWVVAHNDYGHSAPVAVATAEAVAAGDSITFGVTPAGSQATKWFQVYRTPKGKTDITEARLVARVANEAGSGETTVTDLNETMPGTFEAYMWQQDAEAMAWFQLAPFLKIPLATIDATIRWMQLVYGVPVQYLPGRFVRFYNIGRAPGSLSI